MSRTSRLPAALLLAAGLAAVAALSGCSTSKPHLEVKRFTLASPAGPIPEPGAGARVVSLSPVRVAPLYVDPSLVYRLGPDRVEADPYAELAASPRSLVAEALRATLLRSPGVRAVVTGPAGPAGLTVKVLLQEICGDFSRPGEPAAALSLEVSAWSGDPAPGAAPALRKVYSRREPVPARTAEAVVAAWNRSLPSILAEVAADLAAIPPAR